MAAVSNPLMPAAMLPMRISADAAPCCISAALPAAACRGTSEARSSGRTASPRRVRRMPLACLSKRAPPIELSSSASACVAAGWLRPMAEAARCRLCRSAIAIANCRCLRRTRPRMRLNRTEGVRSGMGYSKFESC